MTSVANTVAMTTLAVHTLQPHIFYTVRRTNSAPAGPVLAGASFGSFKHITLGRVGLHGEDVLAPLVQARPHL